MTVHEADLMQRILDHHLNNTLHLTIKAGHDQLIEFDDLMDFIRRAQEQLTTTYNSTNSTRLGTSKKTTILPIPGIHTSYVLPPAAKSMFPAPSETMSKTSPVKPITVRSGGTAPSTNSATTVPSHTGKSTNPTTMSTNGHSTSSNMHVRMSTNVNVKPNISSIPTSQINTPTPTSASIPSLPSTTTPVSTTPTSQISVRDRLEFNPATLSQGKIDGRGWIQINNVFLPFVIKNRHRLIPYDVLVSCKILDGNELRQTLTRATAADRMVMNQMIRECKINNEEIVENASLISVYHVLVGTKNLIYVKLLPMDNPTSKINRQYRSVLALRGGCVCITNRLVPYVCSSNHSYVPLNDIIAIYPNLQSQLKPLARVPRTHEFDHLQLIQLYYDEKELPSDTLLVNIEDLNQRQIIPSKNISLTEYHNREKAKLEQQLSQITNQQSGNNKRKYPEPTSSDKQPTQQKFRSNPLPIPGIVRPPTGYFPNSSTIASSSSPTPSSSGPSAATSSAAAVAYQQGQYQQNNWLSSNYGPNGRTH